MITELKRSPKYVSNRLIAYGAFLVVCGVTGYFLTGETSSSAIVNGLVGGAFIILLGVVYRSGRQWIIPATLSATLIFTLTFIWRGGTQWYLVVNEGTGHLYLALLLSVMCVVSIGVAWLLLRNWKW